MPPAHGPSGPSQPQLPERDPCIVATAPLAAVLTEFVRSWAVTRPHVRPNQFVSAAATERVTTVSAISWLEFETGLPRRKIERVIEGRYRTTELRVADALVQALERPELFKDGTLEIRPNPLAAPAARATCCSDDSLNGSLS